MNAIAFSFREQSKEDIEKMQNRCSIIQVDRLAYCWISGGDFDSVLGMAIATVPLFLCDDVCDRKTEDETTHQMMIDALCRIPKLVHKHWQVHEKNVIDREMMATNVVQEYGLTGITFIDGFSRLLALGSIIARTKAASDVIYNW